MLVLYKVESDVILGMMRCHWTEEDERFTVGSVDTATDLGLFVGVTALSIGAGVWVVLTVSYAIGFDPVDGSSIIPANFAVGIISNSQGKKHGSGSDDGDMQDVE